MLFTRSSRLKVFFPANYRVKTVTLLVPRLLIVLAIFSMLPASGAFGIQKPIAGVSRGSLDRAFNYMYNLDFARARGESQEWEQQHPEDPMGPVAEACALLFSEFDRLHVLQSEFFASDTRFDSRRKLQPDPMLRADFEAALTRAEIIARKVIAGDANNQDALFSLALLNGLRADYAALIEKRDFAALGYTKAATGWAEKLLAIAPGYSDGYLATGLGKYIVGSKPAPMRWALRLAGIKGDRDEGMRDLAITASRGRFLAPFARLLLAVGHLRDKDKAQARQLLAGLRDQFPANPLFAQEVDKIDKSGEIKR